MKIMQTQRDYMLNDNKQIFDNVHRIANIWGKKLKIPANHPIIWHHLNKTSDSRR
jgi:hypothetical protein